jgi:adenine-specific DNA-methyltransferase
MNKAFKEKIIKLFKNDERLWNSERQELNQILLKDLVDKFDEKVVEILLNDSETKKQFFVKVKDSYIFKPNDFKFFLDENKLDNSFTQLANKIGLNFNDETSEKVILNWPFKDCVLEGGMTKEDSLDTYFKYDKTSGDWKEEKTKRKEIFFNEILARDEIDRLEEPKVFYKWKRFTVKNSERGEDVKEIKKDDKGIIKENLVIKGNNLLALHSLKEQFEGKIKLIYIDPPYNTNSDSFTYNDNFNHSTWLTFMKNRLEIASTLLNDQGIIFVQIDHREQAYLKILMDQIFGRDNFLSCINLKSKATGGVGKSDFLLDVTEYILCYAKNIETEFNVPKEEEVFIPEDESNYKYVLEKIDGGKHIQTITGGNAGDIKVYEHTGFKIKSLGKKERILSSYLKEFDKIFRLTNPQGGLMKRVIPQLPTAKDKLLSIEYIPTKGKNKGVASRSYFYNKDLVAWFKDTAKIKEGKIIKYTKKTNFWSENMHQGISSEGNVTLLSGKKPEKLVKQIIEIGSSEGDLVLDYHAGSGTTCAVAHKMGRQWIGIEQLDYSENNPEERMKGVIAGDNTGISKEVGWKGGGDFIYIQLAKWNEEAKEKIIETKSYEELVKLFSGLYKHYFLNYNVRVKDFEESVIKSDEFKKLSLADQKKMFAKMLDLNQMYVNFSERNDKKYNLSKNDIALSEEFYGKK